MGKVGASPTLDLNRRFDLQNPFEATLYSSLMSQQNELAKVKDCALATLEHKWQLAMTCLKKSPNFPVLQSYLLYKLNEKRASLLTFLRAIKDTNQPSAMMQQLDLILYNEVQDIMLESGYFLSQAERASLQSSDLNLLSLSYLKKILFLGKGEAAFLHASTLSDNDFLKYELSKTALLDFARRRELKKSSAVVKNFIIPVVNRFDQNVLYHQYALTLARLLYQAGAYKEARVYYQSIPESSPHYLAAVVEEMWSAYQLNDLSYVKGQMKTLDISLFQKRFIPDYYQLAAITNLRLCHFKDVQKNLKDFQSFATYWLNKLDSSEKEHLNLEDTRNQNLLKFSKSLVKKDENFGVDFVTDLKTLIERRRKRSVTNKKKRISRLINELRFIKVETLAKMRRYRDQYKRYTFKDEVKQYQSAPYRDKNHLTFEYDGMLWGDELFQLRAQGENKCLKI